MVQGVNSSGTRAVLNFSVSQQPKQVFVIHSQFIPIVLHLRCSPDLSRRGVEHVCYTMPSFWGEAFASSVAFSYDKFAGVDEYFVLWLIPPRLIHHSPGCLRLGRSRVQLVKAPTCEPRLVGGTVPLGAIVFHGSRWQFRASRQICRLRKLRIEVGNREDEKKINYLHNR